MFFAWILIVWMVMRSIGACVHFQCICYSTPRGNIYNCKSASLTEVPSNFTADTYIIQLLDNDINWLNNATFDNYVQLWNLDLRRNRLRSLPNKVFSKNTALQFLNLELNSLTYLPRDVFSKNIALKTLNLGWNNLTILPTNLFINNIALTDLSVNDNSISSLPSVVFRNNMDLSKVNFDRNPIVYISADLFDNNNNLGSLQIFCDDCFNCKCISFSIWNWIKKRKNDVMEASFSCANRSSVPADKIAVPCDDDRITLHSASTEESEQICLCQFTTSTNQFTNETSESTDMYQTSELMKAKTSFYTSTMPTIEQYPTTGSIYTPTMPAIEQHPTTGSINSSTMPTIKQHPTTGSIYTHSVNSTEKQSNQTSSAISTMHTTDLTPVSTISPEARMTFETSEKTSHLKMQTLEQYPKTDSIKQFSIKSTRKQRKQTTSAISTMFTTDLKAQPEQRFAISTISQNASDTINKTIATVILGFTATTFIIAVLRRLKGYWTTLRKIRHGDELEAKEVDSCVYDSIEFISSFNDDNSNENIFRNIPPRFQHFNRLDIVYHKELSIETIIQTKFIDTTCTIKKEC